MTHPLLGHHGRSGPNDKGAGELVVSLTEMGGRQKPGLTNSVITEAQTQGLESAHLNIYPISELLEHGKGPALRHNSYRISSTQPNNRIYERSLSEGPVLML